jgi:protein arginine N-methyltransferase 1
MVFDQVRNDAYARAIAKLVTPGCRVLDLGAGLGIHGLMAAAAGAGEVILLEPSQVIGMAADVVAMNGFEDRVTVVRKRAEEAEIEPPVDVLISVFTGNFLLTEDLLPSLFLARERFLKPGGSLLPSGAEMKAALVQAPTYYDEQVACWSEGSQDLDFSSIQKYAANTVHYLKAHVTETQLLTAPAGLLQLDFHTATTASCQCQMEFTVETSGVCHGVLGWFDMQLGDEMLSTAPDAEPTHWSQAFLPLDPPLHVSAGQVVSFELERPEFGEWTWTLTHEGKRQRHSTFHSKPVDLEALRRQQGGIVPGLGVEGELAVFVLTLMQQGKNVAEILAGVQEQFSQQMERDPGVAQSVRRMIDSWSES